MVINDYSTKYPSIYRGEVMDIKDPKNLSRCKISIPGIFGYETPVELLPWARPITNSTINESRGSVNIPDIGDIVWVMFENSNKEYPVYIGGMYGVNDIPVNDRIITLYTENKNAITYNRDESAYTINVGEKNTITVTPEAVTILAGSSTIQISISSGEVNIADTVKINGRLEVNKGINSNSDIRVGGNVYCNNLYENSGGVFGSIISNTDTSKMSEESFDTLLESRGLTGERDWMTYASQFLGMTEAKNTDTLRSFLGINPSTTPWCAAFVSACLKQAGVSGLRSNAVSGLMTQAKSQGLFRDKNSYTPKPGDIFIEKSGGASHTGFVLSVNSDGTYKTLEGNSSNSVKSNIKRISSNKLTGFIQMNNGG